jgi:hypothetical protein
MNGALIRRPQPDEHDSVRALVQTVVDEIYGGLWAPPPLPVEQESWHLSWVAVVDTKIVGMVLTQEEWISDLGGHLKTGHRRTLQNRPTEQNQNKSIYILSDAVGATPLRSSDWVRLGTRQPAERELRATLLRSGVNDHFCLPTPEPRRKSGIE